VQAPKVLWVVAGLLAIAVVGVGALRLYSEQHSEGVERLGLASDCDLRRGACIRHLPRGGRLRFGIEPRNIPVMQTLRLHLELEGVSPRSAVVEFQGVDMNMGFNRASLHSAGMGRYAGTVMLPVCVRERMSWEALVVIETEQSEIGVPFRFDTVRPGVAFSGDSHR